MTGAQFGTYIRKKTRTDSTTFPDAELISFANAVKDEMALRIEEVNEDYFGSVETTDLLVTDTTREYPFPEDMLNRMKMLEAQFDGTNWVRLLELDLNLYNRTTDDTIIEQYFANEYGKAFYDIFRGSLWLYTGEIDTQVDDGLKLWLFSFPADLSADGAGAGDEATLDLSGDDPATEDLSIDPSTTALGFPRAFHRLWADGVVIEYKQSRDTPLPLSEREQNYEYHLVRALQAIKGTNRDRALIMDVPDQDDNDDGYDY